MSRLFKESGGLDIKISGFFFIREVFLRVNMISFSQTKNIVAASLQSEKKIGFAFRASDFLFLGGKNVMRYTR